MTKRQNKTAQLVEKTDIRATLMSFSVGDEMIISEKDSRYPCIFGMANKLAKTTDRRFYVTMKNIPNGTLVRRTA